MQATAAAAAGVANGTKSKHGKSHLSLSQLLYFSLETTQCVYVTRSSQNKPKVGGHLGNEKIEAAGTFSLSPSPILSAIVVVPKATKNLLSPFRPFSPYFLCVRRTTTTTPHSNCLLNCPRAPFLY